MNTKTRTATIVAASVTWIALFFNLSTAQAQNDRLYARIVLFIPVNAAPPKDYVERLGSVGTRAEVFFDKWLRHWDRNVPRKEIFVRDDKGKIQVTLVKGHLKDPKSKSVLEDLRRQAIQGAKSQLNIRQNTKVLWWIFHAYPGAKGYIGGGNSTYGTAINEYPPGTGPIRQNMDLASKKMADLKIKGMMHEFGHGLGLPHNGPRPDLNLGNSLMGPINRIYSSRTRSRDTRVYLNPASAALLWKHPVFQIKTPPKPTLPRLVDLTGLTAKENKDGTFEVHGHLKSSVDAHSVVLFDSRDNKFGDYWSRSYVGEINDGQFKILVKDPFDEGTIFLCFCFDNGVNSADGKSHFSRKSVVQIPYAGKPGKRKFRIPE